VFLRGFRNDSYSFAQLVRQSHVAHRHRFSCVPCGLEAVTYSKGQSRLTTGLVVRLVGIAVVAWNLCAAEAKTDWCKAGPYQTTPSDDLRYVLSSFSPGSTCTARLRIAAISGGINAHGFVAFPSGPTLSQGSIFLCGLLVQSVWSQFARSCTAWGKGHHAPFQQALHSPGHETTGGGDDFSGKLASGRFGQRSLLRNVVPNSTSVRVMALTNVQRAPEHQSVPVLHGGLALALVGLSMAGIALFRRG
jgi:hypothetical protein